MMEILAHEDKTEEAALEKVILFESFPDFSGNSWAVYQTLRALGTDSPRMIWIGEEKSPDVPAGVEYICKNGTKEEKERWKSLQERAKLMVSSDRFFLQAGKPGQHSVFLPNSSPLKSDPDTRCFDRFEYVLTRSAWMVPYTAQENRMRNSTLVSPGIPHNDALFHPDGALERLNYTGYDKIIAWLPTCGRQKTGLPLIPSAEEAASLNELLRSRNALLVIMPDPAQDLSQLMVERYSNVAFSDQDLLRRCGVELYAFLGATDALITDYSGVYYDYLLTGKPIGLTMDELAANTEERAFVFDDPMTVLKGYQLLNGNDLRAFLTDVSDGKNARAEETAQVSALLNDYCDDNSSKRVGEFILKLLNDESLEGEKLFPIKAGLSDDEYKARKQQLIEENKYLFSVIMPVYNVERYLDEAVESVVEQTIGLKYIQLILVDDGSTDRSGKLCDSYKKKYPKNVFVIHKENGGVSSARNAGLEIAEGLLITFLDSDDKLKTNALKNVFDFYIKHMGETDVIAIPMFFFEAEEGPHRQNLKYSTKNKICDLTKEWAVPHSFMCSSFFLRSAAKQYRVDTRLSYSEDFCYAQKVLLDKLTIGLVSSTAYYYRKRANGSSAMQTSVNNRRWYLPSLLYFMEEMISFSKEKKGYVPLFTQYNIMYELQWKLAQREFPEGVLSESEQAEYIEKIKSLIRQLDPRVIDAQQFLSPFHKAYAKELTGTEAAHPEDVGDDLLVVQDGTTLARLSSVLTKFTNLDIKRNRLILSVDVTVPLDGAIEFGLDINGEFFPADISQSEKSSAFYDKCFTRKYRCALSVPLRGKELRIVPAFRWNRKTYTGRVFYRYPFPIAQKYETAAIGKGGWIVKHDGDCLVVAKGRLDRRDHEKAVDEELLNKDAPGTREAIELRSEARRMKGHKLRQLWLLCLSDSSSSSVKDWYDYLLRKGNARVVVAASDDSPIAGIPAESLCRRDSAEYRMVFLLADRIYYDDLSLTNPWPEHEGAYRDMLFGKKFVDCLEPKNSSWLKEIK